MRPPAKTDAAALYRAAFRVLRQARRLDGSLGLGPAQTDVLSLLATEGALSIRRLAQAEGVAHPTMSRMLSSLQRIGFVHKVVDPEDRRSQIVAITDDGMHAYEAAYRWRENVAARILARLSAQAVSELLHALEVVGEDIRAERPARRS